jgi:hypothetical protein
MSRLIKAFLFISTRCHYLVSFAVIIIFAHSTVVHAKRPSELDALYDTSGGYSSGGLSEPLTGLFVWALGGFLSAIFLLSKGFSSEAAWGIGLTLGGPILMILISLMFFG